MNDFQKALDNLQNRYRGEPGCKDLLVSSSFVNGIPGPYSDLDVFVLT